MLIDSNLTYIPFLYLTVPEAPLPKRNEQFNTGKGDCDNLFKYSFMNKILVSNTFGLLHQNITNDSNMSKVIKSSTSSQKPINQ